MTRPNRTRLRIAFIAALIGAVGFGGYLSKPKAMEENKEKSDHQNENSGPVLDKCPVSRKNFDRLQLGMPEWMAMDTLLCIKGEVIQEYDVGFGRRSVPLRIWKFPREGGGYIIVTTTGYSVSAKKWE